jgi:D-psicose/D-tagatose/L-ribulose 3-epimerase
MSEYKNVIGVHALVWTGDTDNASLESAAQQTKAAGFDLLELSLHQLDSLDIPAATTVFKEVGIQVACSRGLAFDADVSSDDNAVVAKGEALLYQSLEATAALGATILTGALYSALGKYNQPLTKAGYANVVRVLSGLAVRAAELDMTLGLEICNRYETNVINTAQQALRLADDIGHDNVLIHLDSYHMNIEESNLIAPVLEVGDRLGYVHIGENNRGLLGSGSLNFGSFFWALDQVNYTGPITFESFSSAIVSERLSNDLAIWRNLWDDNTELATQARTFIDAQLRAARSSVPVS